MSGIEYSSVHEHPGGGGRDEADGVEKINKHEHIIQ